MAGMADTLEAQTFSLPDAVLENIAEFLSPWDLLAAACTCRHWRNVLSAHAKGVLVLPGTDQVSSYQTVTTRIKRFPKASNVLLWLPTDKAFPGLAENLSAAFQALACCTADGISQALQLFLEQHHPFRAYLFNHHPHLVPQPKYLNNGRQAAQACGTALAATLPLLMSKLETLGLTTVYPALAQIQHQLVAMTKLQMLRYNLPADVQLPRTDVQCMLALTQLKQLDFAGNLVANLAEVLAAVSALTLLTSLTVAHVTHDMLPVVSPAPGLAKLVNLEVLTLKAIAIHLVDIQGLVALIKLRELQLTYSTNITHAELQALDSMQSLTKLLLNRDTPVSLDPNDVVPYSPPLHVLASMANYPRLVSNFKDLRMVIKQQRDLLQLVSLKGLECLDLVLGDQGPLGFGGAQHQPEDLSVLSSLTNLQEVCLELAASATSLSQATVARLFSNWKKLKAFQYLGPCEGVWNLTELLRLLPEVEAVHLMSAELPNNSTFQVLLSTLPWRLEVLILSKCDVICTPPTQSTASSLPSSSAGLLGTTAPPFSSQSSTQAHSAGLQPPTQLRVCNLWGVRWLCPVPGLAGGLLGQLQWCCMQQLLEEVNLSFTPQVYADCCRQLNAFPQLQAHVQATTAQHWGSQSDVLLGPLALLSCLPNLHTIHLSLLTEPTTGVPPPKFTVDDVFLRTIATLTRLVRLNLLFEAADTRLQWQEMADVACLTRLSRLAQCAVCAIPEPLAYVLRHSLARSRPACVLHMNTTP